jgi:hypothetical protein
MNGQWDFGENCIPDFGPRQKRPSQSQTLLIQQTETKIVEDGGAKTTPRSDESDRGD